MDYTSLAYLKKELRIESTNVADDSYLTTLIGQASRVVDLLATNGVPNVTDYFTLATVVDEPFGRSAVVDVNGNLSLWPHKAVVNSVAGINYRWSPLGNWQPFESNRILTSPDSGKVEVWTSWGTRPGRLFGQISYSGGYGPAVTDLPPMVVRLTTLLAGRFYREGEGGLNDVMGVAELGTLVYTKALPQEFKYLIGLIARPVPW